MSYLKKNYRIIEEKVNIKGIPAIRLYPEGKEGPLESLIFYHGLGSSKESQRIRGYIIGSFGYQVIIPDSIHHGERDPKLTEDPTEIYRYFWQAILQSIDESELIVDALIDEFNGDPDNIYVTGHSMGGYISAGIVVHNPGVRGAMPINGSFNWQESNRIMKELFGTNEEIEEDRKLAGLDPINNIELLKDKDILILHGELDPEVDIGPQRKFFKEIREKYPDYQVDMIEHEGVGHFVTTGMMEDLIAYLDGRIRK